MKTKIFLPLLLSALFTVMNVSATPEEARREVDLMADIFRDYGWTFRDYYRYGSLYEGQSSVFTSTFYAGVHYVLLVGGCKSAEDVDLYVYDVDGLAKQDRNADQWAEVDFTPVETGTLTIKVLMYQAYSDNVAVHWALRYGFK